MLPVVFTEKNNSYHSFEGKLQKKRMFRLSQNNLSSFMMYILEWFHCVRLSKEYSCQQPSFKFGGIRNDCLWNVYDHLEVKELINWNAS